MLPEKLQEQEIKLTHNLPHLGQNNTENLMTNRIHFQSYSTKVRKYVLDCPVCQHVNSIRRMVPSGMSLTSTKCFECINCNFKGPLNDGIYVHVFIDQFSKWPKIYLTKSESFKAVKRHFTSWFAAHGYPKFIKTDNGSPYQSAAFKLFLDDQE